MGDAVEDMLNGIVCQVCGIWMPDFEEVGYPRTCPSCLKEDYQTKEGEER